MIGRTEEDLKKAVPLYKLLDSLEGSSNVLKTHKPEDAFEQGRIQGWSEAVGYLLKLCRAFSKDER